MSDFKFAPRVHRTSVSTVACDGYSMEEAFEIVASCGARFVEPAYIEGYVDFEESSFSSANARKLRMRLHDCGLESPTVSAHIDLGAAVSARRLTERIRFAAEMGAETLITNLTTTAKLEAAVHAISANIDELDRQDINLAVENPGHGMNAVLSDGDSIRSFLSLFGHDRVLCNFDVCNMYTYHMGQIDPYREFNAVSDKCRSLHLKNVRQDHDSWYFTDLANGELSYGAQTDFLRNAPDDMVLVIEHPTRMSRPSRNDPVRSRARAGRDEITTAISRSLSFLDMALR